MWIAAINVDVMTTATVTAVGARQQCPRMQEHHRGLGVAPDPDNWLTMRTISAGGGHGPIVLGKLEAGGEVNCVTQRSINSYFYLHREMFYLTPRFFTSAV